MIDVVEPMGMETMVFFTLRASRSAAASIPTRAPARAADEDARRPRQHAPDRQHHRQGALISVVPSVRVPSSCRRSRRAGPSLWPRSASRSGMLGSAGRRSFVQGEIDGFVDGQGRLGDRRGLGHRRGGGDRAGEGGRYGRADRAGARSRCRRRRRPIKKAGGKATVKPGDLMKAAAVDADRQGDRDRSSAAATSWSTMPGSTSSSAAGRS